MRSIADGRGVLSANKYLFAERTPHPALRATFSHKGRRKSACPQPFGGASGWTISLNGGSDSQAAECAFSAG
jgi:hypothetical protein